MEAFPCPQVGLSLQVEPSFAHACLPLIGNGEVEFLEWSFDMGWGPDPIPIWCDKVLRSYSDAGRLIGHGVSFSLLSGQWTQRHQDWLTWLSHEIGVRRYRHISEHFGFMTAGNFHQGAPLPVPLTSASLKLGRERLKMIREVAEVPVGLENLALAFGPEDVAQQGEFLEGLLESVDGFLVLDLHNVYCQLCNFKVEPEKLLASYPLHRVREVHISGGSWSASEAEPGVMVRRDTHDDDVPDRVFELLRLALPKCPSVEVVIFERLGYAFADEAATARFSDDFRKIKTVVREAASASV